MSKLILPEHVKKQRAKQKRDEESKKRQEAADADEQITVNMVTAPSHTTEGRFAAVVMYEGFVTERAAQDFLTAQAAAMRGNRKERRLKAKLEGEK